MAERDKFYHPYEPYSIQYDLMRVIYDTIESGKVGILESPTGTGKSLSLICSSFAWLRDLQHKEFDQDLAVEERSDEPQWVLQQEREQRQRAVYDQISALEARLQSIRAKEIASSRSRGRGEPPAKRVKGSIKEDSSEVQDDADFELPDYNSDEETHSTKKPDKTHGDALAGISASNFELMQQLGLVPKVVTEEDEDLIDGTKIFLASRTHSQLTQFVKEIQRVQLPNPPALSSAAMKLQPADRVAVKHLPLGSRKTLCINPKVASLKTSTAITERCLELQKPGTSTDKRCSFLPSRENHDLVREFGDRTLASVNDIEDIVPVGKRLGICPYYASRAAIRPSEIVTLPYPLLLQRSAREVLDVSLKGHIVIIDEAHNLMDTISDLHSTQISRDQLMLGRRQLAVYLQKFRNRLKGKNRVYIAQLMRMIDSISSYLASRSDEKTNDGKAAIADIMAGKGVDQINLNKVIHYLQESKLARKVEGYMLHAEQQASKQSSIPRANSDSRESSLPILSQIQSFLEILANPADEGRFFYEKDDNHDISLRYMLLDPTHQFRDIVEEARAVILAGGTMSPMEDYTRYLLGYVDPQRIVQFSCGHITPKENLLVLAPASGMDDVEQFDFTLAKRNSKRLLDSLGHSIAAIAETVPDGLVVFFPSYVYLDEVVASWKAGPLWSKIDGVKPVFQETKGVSSVDQTLVAYSEAIDSGRGGLLLAVIGGKLSEGINFSDRLGRGVVVVGMPFPNVHTAQWKAKLEYVQHRVSQQTGSTEEGRAASRAFVENACMRAVNQSVGRAIRHREDYAAIILLDQRYGQERIQAKLPAWIRQAMRPGTDRTFRNVVDELQGFFKLRSTT